MFSDNIFRNRLVLECICTRKYSERAYKLLRAYGIRQTRYTTRQRGSLVLYIFAFLLRPPCVADADIIFFNCGFFFLSFFIPRLFSAVADWMSTILFYTWCGPIVNLECRSEICYTRLAANAGPKKSPKIHHLGTITQLCRAISSQLRHVSTIGKNLLNSNVSPHVFTIW